MKRKTADPQLDLLHGTSVKTKVVLIDPQRVTRYSAVRPITAAAVDAVFHSLRASKGFEGQHAVTCFIDAATSDVYIRDGAHRVMAVLLGWQVDPDVFDPTMVPMIALEEIERIDSCEALLAFDSNEQSGVRKEMSFADHVASIARARETANEAYFISKGKPLVSCTWNFIKTWTTRQSEPASRAQVKSFLTKKYMSIIYNIVKAMLPQPRLCRSSPLSTPGYCAWEMYYFIGTNDSKCPASRSMPFTEISDVLGSPAKPGSSSTRHISAARHDKHDQAETSSKDTISRRALDCPFFRGNYSNTPQTAETPAFLTVEQATAFEKVLFMSKIHHMRLSQRSRAKLWTRSPRSRQEAETR
jgi:hypothetical protein